MAIQAGQRLGPYEILSAIGAGGMGEVYRAHDGRLNRDVALKVLPEIFATDPDRMSRFEREAPVLGVLSHPNIAAIHGREEFNSSRAAVMEVVSGATLADRIAKGPIPLDEALVLAFMGNNPSFDLYTLPLSDGKPQPFLRTSSNQTAPRFSPDGHFIAYASNESGRYEIYARPSPGPGGKWQISTDGGGEPVWNPKGRELFYRNGNKMMAVDVTTQGTFSAGKPRVLFEGGYVPTPRSFPDYDVYPDGRRFLMLKANDQGQSPEQLNVVLNWLEELKQKAPTGKR